MHDGTDGILCLRIEWYQWFSFGRTFANVQCCRGNAERSVRNDIRQDSDTGIESGLGVGECECAKDELAGGIGGSGSVHRDVVRLMAMFPHSGPLGCDVDARV